METLEVRAPEIQNEDNIKQAFPVTGMNCVVYSSSVESILTHTEGVANTNVNFASSSVLVEYDQSLTPNNLRNALQSVGYVLMVDEDDPSEVQAEMQLKHYEDVKKQTLLSAILTLLVFIIGIFFMDWAPSRWISLVFTIPVIFWFGRSFFIIAIKQAKHGKANMDTLVAMSTGIAFIFSLFNTLFSEFWHARGHPSPCVL